MSEPVVPESTVARRSLMRGGALVAGAAGAALAIEALGASTAHAATGDPVVAGQNNTASSTTQLSMDGAAQSTLTVRNDNGAALNLAPTTATPSTLHAGDVVGRAMGPDVVVDYGDGPELTYLATGFDIPPTTMAFAPLRVMDTRSASFRNMVVRASSSNPFDSSKRVKAGSWIDVGLADDSWDLYATYLNVTTIGASARGNLVVYPSGSSTPSSSNLNYPATTSIANLCFVAPALVSDTWCVRVKVNVAATHVILDFSGLVGFPPLEPVAARGKVPATAAARVAARHRRSDDVRKRLARSLKLTD